MINFRQKTEIRALYPNLRLENFAQKNSRIFQNVAVGWFVVIISFNRCLAVSKRFLPPFITSLSICN